MLENTHAVLSIRCPLSLIEVSFRWSPYSEAILFAIFPFSLKNFPVMPLKLAIAWSNTFNKLSFIQSVYIFLAAIEFFIILIVPFEY